jgi:hypothetical protein
VDTISTSLIGYDSNHEDVEDGSGSVCESALESVCRCFCLVWLKFSALYSANTPYTPTKLITS